jgi:hypothetical protein
MSEAIFTEREALEVMDPSGLARFVLRQADVIARAEHLIGLAHDVCGAYGTTIEEQIDILQNDKNQTISSPGY